MLRDEASPAQKEILPCGQDDNRMYQVFTLSSSHFLELKYEKNYITYYLLSL